MNNKKHLVLRRSVLTVAIVFMLAIVVTVVSLKPKVFTFYADVESNYGISGQVFKSSDGIFLVKLNSGSQLTVQQNPPKVFLLTKQSVISGFGFGRYLFLPASEIGGLDLSKSESFDRQVPIFSNNKVTLKDPMNKNGVFDFPLN